MHNVTEKIIFAPKCFAKKRNTPGLTGVFLSSTVRQCVLHIDVFWWCLVGDSNPGHPA